MTKENQTIQGKVENTNETLLGNHVHVDTKDNLTGAVPEAPVTDPVTAAMERVIKPALKDLISAADQIGNAAVTLSQNYARALNDDPAYGVAKLIAESPVVQRFLHPVTPPKFVKPEFTFFVKDTEYANNLAYIPNDEPVTAFFAPEELHGGFIPCDLKRLHPTAIKPCKLGEEGLFLIEGSYSYCRGLDVIGYAIVSILDLPILIQALSIPMFAYEVQRDAAVESELYILNSENPLDDTFVLAINPTLRKFESISSITINNTALDSIRNVYKEVPDSEEFKLLTDLNGLRLFVDKYVLNIEAVDPSKVITV